MLLILALRQHEVDGHVEPHGLGFWPLLVRISAWVALPSVSMNTRTITCPCSPMRLLMGG